MKQTKKGIPKSSCIWEHWKTFTGYDIKAKQGWMDFNKQRWGQDEKEAPQESEKEDLPCDRYHAKYFSINSHLYLITDHAGKSRYYYSHKTFNWPKKFVQGYRPNKR